MKIHIAHLYYDLLNLYGENGNIKALKKALEKNHDVYIHFLTIGDTLELDKYDFIYIGMGTEENMHIALKHLIKYKDELKKYIESNKIILATGNSFEMFGKFINYKGKHIKALNLFAYYSEDTDKRIIGEKKVICPFISKPIIGFENRGSVTKGQLNFLETGYNYKNFYGTYIIGPILVRNPELLKYFIYKLTKKHEKIDLKLEEEAYIRKEENYNV